MSIVAERGFEMNFDSHDDLVRMRVMSYLRATGYRALQSVHVWVHEGLVSLRGDVPNFHVKQVATSAALLEPDVLELRNELSVVPDFQPGMDDDSDLIGW